MQRTLIAPLEKVATGQSDIGERTLIRQQREPARLRRLPLGYNRVVIDGVAAAVPDPLRAPLVKLAFFRAAQPRSSLRDVLEILADAGLTTLDGKPLAVSSLHRLLANPFFAGRVRTKDGTGQGSHEALISMSLFRKVQRRLRKRRC